MSEPTTEAGRALRVSVSEDMKQWMGPLILAIEAEARADALDVEALAGAIFRVTVAEPGLLSDVDMLNDPTEGDPRPAAEAISREYRAILAERQP